MKKCECGQELDGKQWVVACYGPRSWDIVEDYDGIENDFGNLNGLFECKACAEAHADRLSS